MDTLYKMTLVIQKVKNFGELISSGALKFGFFTSSINLNKAKIVHDESSLHEVNALTASTCKLSLDASAIEKMEGINSGLSSNSTVEGSSSSLQVAHAEMECALKGDVTVKVEHRP